MPGDGTRRNLWLGTVEGLAASPWVFVTVPANFVVAALLTQHYRVPPGVYGLIASLPAWFNAAQLVLMPFLRQGLAPKTITVVFSWANLLLWAALLPLLSWLPPGEPIAATFFLVFFAATSFTGSILGVGWTAWVQEWVPPRLRGKYFGRRNALIGLATLAFLGLSAATLGAGKPGALTPFVLVLAMTLGFRLVSLNLLSRIDAPPAPAAAPAALDESWMRQARVLLAARPYRRLLAFGMLTGFFANLTTPFLPVFQFEQLGVAPGRVNLLFLVSSVAAALAIPAWGRFLDTHGARPVLFLSVAGWEGANFAWAFVTRDTTWLLVPLYAWVGLTSSAYLLGMFHLLLKLLTRENRTVGASLYSAATSLAAACAPVVSGLLLGWAVSAGWDLLMVYRAGFVTRSTGALLSLALLDGLREPRATPLRTVLGAMYSFRLGLVAQGLPQVGNMTLARRRRPAAGPPREDL